MTRFSILMIILNLWLPVLTWVQCTTVKTDVGDEMWRRNVLATLRCWWRPITYGRFRHQYTLCLNLLFSIGNRHSNNVLTINLSILDVASAQVGFAGQPFWISITAIVIANKKKDKLWLYVEKYKENKTKFSFRMDCQIERSAKAT